MAQPIHEEARRIILSLPPGATWEDLMQRLSDAAFAADNLSQDSAGMVSEPGQPYATTPEPVPAPDTTFPETGNVRQGALSVLDAMPQEATWDDFMLAINVRTIIEAGLNESHAGAVVSAADVRAQFGLGR